MKMKYLNRACFMVLLALALSGCKGDKEENNSAWEASYRETIGDIEDYLIDANEMENVFNGYAYLGVHDFNEDGIPELVMGNNQAIGIYTTEANSVKKVAELYEPEEWGGINSLFYKDNSIMLVSDGSDGSGYVCFTYQDGQYITGIHDDYNAEGATVNGIESTFEEFSQIFDFNELKAGNKVELTDISDENSVESVNFTTLTW